MHTYLVMFPLDMDRIMSLITAAVKTFGNQGVHVSDDHRLIVRTSMDSDEFLKFLVHDSGSGLGPDEFTEEVS